MEVASMKVKRFFAPDIRQAIQMVKAEQGPDAVILSNHKVEGGVEVVSAIDYDAALLQQQEEERGSAQSAAPYQAENDNEAEVAEVSGHEASESPISFPHEKPSPRHNEIMWSQEPALIEMRQELKSLRSLLENQLSGLAWGDLSKRNPLQAELLQRLMKLGLSATVCNQISGRLQRGESMEELWQHAMSLLSHHIKVTGDTILQQGGVVALVGPTGVGKTTTIAKLATRYALQKSPRSVAFISADSFRIGAHDQLRRFGRILDIPVRNVSNRDELMSALNDFYDRELVLIDTVGLGQRDKRLAEQVEMLRCDNPLIKTYLVMSSTTRLSGMQEIIKGFHNSAVQGCVFTKLDEATSLGSALSVLIQNQLPVSYIADGQQIPDDLHVADAQDLVKRSVTLMNQYSPLLEDESLPLTLGRALTDVHVGYKN